MRSEGGAQSRNENGKRNQIKGLNGASSTVGSVENVLLWCTVEYSYRFRASEASMLSREEKGKFQKDRRFFDISEGECERQAPSCQAKW